MSFVREGIEDVWMVVLPEGVTEEGRGAAVSRFAMVMWCSANVGLLHQVYLNGRLAGVTVDSEQRCLPVRAPTSFLSSARVTVVAVAQRDAHTDFAGQPGLTEVIGGRVKLALLRSQTLPIGAAANVYFDGGTGQIDLTEPLNALAIPVWPHAQDKAGFATACFGTGDFGYDAAAAVGLGKGVFALGQFGLDADVIEWLSPVLPPGQYRFGVRICDEFGNESELTETGPITVARGATPASRLETATFDPGAAQLTLSVTD